MAIFHVPPECQGQTTEWSYCQLGRGLLRRKLDRSLPEGHEEREQYSLALLEDDEGVIKPWNEEPIIETSRWQPISRQEVDRAMDEGPTWFG